MSFICLISYLGAHSAVVWQLFSVVQILNVVYKTRDNLLMIASMMECDSRLWNLDLLLLYLSTPRALWFGCLFLLIGVDWLDVSGQIAFPFIRLKKANKEKVTEIFFIKDLKIFMMTIQIN